MLSKKRTIRLARHLAMRDTIVKFLCDGLDATTSYHEPETPRTPRTPKWTPFYGCLHQLEPSAVLSADGKPTSYNFVKRWVDRPGDKVTSQDGTAYLVMKDHSLRKMSSGRITTSMRRTTKTQTNDSQRTEDSSGPHSTGIDNSTQNVEACCSDPTSDQPRR